MGIRIKNWSDYQHYKDRCPPWIKLHRRLLDDREFHALDGESAKTLMLLWILAAEAKDGELPELEDIAFRLRVDSKALARQIIGLDHWIIYDDSKALATCEQHATSETETERETERETEPAPARDTKKKSNRAIQIPQKWNPTDAHDKLALELGVSVSAEAEKFRDHFTANEKPLKNWDAAFRNWLRRSVEFKANRSPPSGGQPRSGLHSDLADWARQKEEEENVTRCNQPMLLSDSRVIPGKVVAEDEKDQSDG